MMMAVPVMMITYHCSRLPQRTGRCTGQARLGRRSLGGKGNFTHNNRYFCMAVGRSNEDFRNVEFLLLPILQVYKFGTRECQEKTLKVHIKRVLSSYMHAL